MNKEYDIFERLADGTPIWRCHVVGLSECSERLQEVAAESGNECFAIHLFTNEIVSRFKPPASRAANRRPHSDALNAPARLAADAGWPRVDRQR